MNKINDEITFVVNSDNVKTHAIVPIELFQELQSLKNFFNEDLNLDEKENFYFSVKGISAIGFPIGKKNRPSFMLLEGSLIAYHYANSLRGPVRELRDNLINSQKLILDEKHNCYRLTENYLFSSASFAASLVAGNNRNGLDVWETKDGYTLKNLGYGSSNDTDEE